MEEEKSDQDRIAEIKAIFRDRGDDLVFGVPADEGGQWGVDAVQRPPRNDFYVVIDSGVGSTELEAAESVLAALRARSSS